MGCSADVVEQHSACSESNATHLVGRVRAVGRLVEARKDSVYSIRVATPYIHVERAYDIIVNGMRAKHMERSRYRRYIHEADAPQA